MKIYIALCNDRHSDPEIKPFNEKSAAIRYSKAFVHDYARHSDDIVEEEVEGYVYFCRYSCEGDYVYVKEAELK